MSRSLALHLGLVAALFALNFLLPAYHHGNLASHLIGYLGEITEEELGREPGRYVAGDWIGRRGIERAFDAQLRGQDGERVVVVDSRGQLVDEYRRELGRPGEPAEVAAAVAFLAGEDSGFITGQTIYVNGGASMG